MNTERIHELIRYILEEANQNEEGSFRELGPIHLLKYVYLADFYYASQNEGRTFTDIDWQFYHFGPWSRELHNELPNIIEIIGANTRIFESIYSKDSKRFSLSDDYRNDSPCSLPFSIVFRLRQDIRNFGSATNDLLHYVYTTPPMTNAVPGNLLNFNHAISPKKTASDMESVPQLSDREKKKRKQRILDIREKIAKKREESRKKRIRPVPPRYDEVFFYGTMELDREFEYQQIENHTGLLQVNQNAWSGDWRKDYELP